MPRIKKCKAIETPVEQEVFPPLTTEYELNGNSNKYNWNENFVQKVADKIFLWFNRDESLWFYSDFPRIDLKMTFNQFVRKMSEFPLIWDDIHNELKLITTTRLAKAMLTERISVPGAIQALKNMGERWNDRSDVNLNVKSIGELISDAWAESSEMKTEKKKLATPTPPPELTDEEREFIYKGIEKL